MASILIQNDVINIYTAFIGMKLIYYENYFNPSRISFRPVDSFDIY